MSVHVEKSRCKDKGFSQCDEGCSLCIGRKITTWYHEEDLFYCCDCKSCAEPMVVFSQHREPTDEEFMKMIQWAEKRFPNRKIDLTRRDIPDHFHFHMRLESGLATDLKTRKSYLKCPICRAPKELTEFEVCSLCGGRTCKSCIKEYLCPYCLEGRQESHEAESGEDMFKDELPDFDDTEYIQQTEDDQEYYLQEDDEE